MQPKFILYSTTIVGLLIVVLTNVVQDTTGVFPTWLVSIINIALPSLVMARRFLGELGQPPVTILPPTPAVQAASLVTQEATIRREMGALVRQAELRGPPAS